MCSLSYSTSKPRFYSVLKNLCTLTVLKRDRMDSEAFYFQFCILGKHRAMAEFQTFHCRFTVSRIRALSLARADLLCAPARKKSLGQWKLYNHQLAAVFHSIFRVVNRGGDTDTIGAVTGALAGGRFDKRFAARPVARYDRLS